ncbi:hypothetical protein MHBO_003810 [Bonamia ostreae]|uniref:Uncharacterized protein n=1 Tax=Bonamia ostreae TaxID=126728 RepID=A0ABV2ARM7_9EUKA
MAGDNFAEDVRKKDSKGDEKAKENEIDLLDIELEGGDFTERFQEKDGVDKNDGRASASNSLDLIDSLSPSFDKLQIEGDPKKAAKNLFETENYKTKSSEKDVLAKSQNIADEKLKQMIPGSDLVDLEGLMKRGSKGTFRSKDKKRMNQM